MKKDPQERLGCGSGSIDDLINHNVFKRFNWKRIDNGLETPPFVPVIVVFFLNIKFNIIFKFA